MKLKIKNAKKALLKQLTKIEINRFNDWSKNGKCKKCRNF